MYGLLVSTFTKVVYICSLLLYPGVTPLQEAYMDVLLGRIFTTGVTITGSHFQQSY